MQGVGSYGITFPRKRWRTAAELRAENAWLREELARRDAELQRVNAELAVVAGPSQNSLITGLARQWAQVSAATLAGEHHADDGTSTLEGRTGRARPVRL